MSSVSESAVQLAQDGERLGHLLGEDAGDLRRHAGELGVARAEVLRPVELVEEVARGRAVARAGQQVGVSVGEAPLLKRLQRGHSREQVRRRRPALPLGVDGFQVMGDVRGGGCHRYILPDPREVPP